MGGMESIIAFLMQNPDLPVDVGILVVIFYALSSFRRESDRHYQKDEEYQRKQIALLEKIAERVR